MASNNTGRVTQILGAVVDVVVGLATTVEVVGTLVALELLVVELPPLPQAARSAAHNSARTSNAGRLPIIDSPLVGESDGPGR